MSAIVTSLPFLRSPPERRTNVTRFRRWRYFRRQLVQFVEEPTRERPRLHPQRRAQARSSTSLLTPPYSPSCRGALQVKEGDVVLLLPALPYEGVKPSMRKSPSACSSPCSPTSARSLGKPSLGKGQRRGVRIPCEGSEYLYLPLEGVAKALEAILVAFRGIFIIIAEAGERTCPAPPHPRDYHFSSLVVRANIVLGTPPRNVCGSFWETIVLQSGVVTEGTTDQERREVGRTHTAARVAR